jgi:hypothetical protein
MKQFENVGRRINGFDDLRFYETLHSGPGRLFVVQRINGFGRHDRRCKIQEKREVLLESADRAEAVAFFNKYLKEHRNPPVQTVTLQEYEESQPC